VIFSYSAIPCYSNYANPNATKIELSGVQSQHELIVFRPGIAAKANGDDGQLFDKISEYILSTIAGMQIGLVGFKSSSTRLEDTYLNLIKETL